MNLKYYCVTSDGEAAYLNASEFVTEEEAEAFKLGVEYVNDSAIEIVGIFKASSEAAAIDQADAALLRA